MPNTFSQALVYLSAGYSVIPCGQNKRPLVDAWKPYQTERPTEEKLKSWWTTWPEANVAVITGAISGLTVIDVDGEKGLASIRDYGIAAQLPPTRVIKTPHGHHLYFQFNQDFHTGAGFLPGLDVRSEGGYVVAPPSEAEGLLYQVFRDRPILPLTLTNEHFQGHSRGEAIKQNTDTPGWVSEALSRGAPENQRNATAIKLAGYFHSKNIPDDIVLATLLEFGRKCQPPMDERELETVVRSAARYPTKPDVIHIEDAPTMEVLGDTYRFEWAKYGLVVLLEQLHEDKEGVHSEITLLSQNDGATRYLYGPIRYNLTASVQRSGITKHLKDYDGLDADKMLQDLSRMTITEHRKGEAPVYLADVEALAEPEWAIDKLLLAGHPNILFGQGGTAKSYLALAMMLTLQAGRNIGLGLQPSRAMRGLYLDWEFEAADHHQRMAWLCGDDFEIAGLGVMYLRCTGSLYSMITKLRKIVIEHSIDFIVVDSIAIACGGEPEKAENALRFFDAIRALKVTSLCIAHTTKEESNGMPFGSVFFHNSARNTWEIFKDQTEGGGIVSVMLKHRKSNVGPLLRPVGISLTFANNRVAMTVGDADESIPVFLAKMSQHQQVWTYLEDGAKTSAEISAFLAEQVGKAVSLDQARVILGRGKESFVHLPDGRWGRRAKLA